MEKVVVVGGGASGLVAAIYSARRGFDVSLVERYSDCAKKILVTGNGRCNFWNSNQKLCYYHSSNADFVSKVITDNNQNEILNFFSDIGIVSAVKNGYYYPYSNQAVAIKEALLIEARLIGVKIINDYEVKKAIWKNDKYILSDGNRELTCDYLIIATGSYAYYKEGNNGYDLAHGFGHRIVKVLPSLVQVRGREKYFKNWAGVRCEVNITLNSSNEVLKEEYGEILLTDYGASGICVFNVSGIAARLLDKKEKVFLHINFVPWFDGGDFSSFLERRIQTLGNRKVDEFLEGFLNYKLVYVILREAGIDKSLKYTDLSALERKKLTRFLTDFSFEIVGTNSFDKAQVCTGGVDTSEVNPVTMESLKSKGLFFAGEILDVDGDCGGYNLSFAWISGMLAGKNVGD